MVVYIGVLELPYLPGLGLADRYSHVGEEDSRRGRKKTSQKTLRAPNDVKRLLRMIVHNSTKVL
jgi:hypothetical protein